MSDSKTAVVSIKSGKLEGNLADGLYSFKGIPYAAPPLGELRWMPPQPVKPWQGVRSAKTFGPIAPQTLLPGGPIVKAPQPQSEDCLFLNVWTPGLDNAKRPVMVWIHGGAFTMGSGSEPNTDGNKLVKKGNIVFVSINYRVGMLGFMRLKDATGGKIPSTGNEGFLDQVAALKWVKANIAAFGGDPANVTVFGESAGSMSIACLMVMPAAKGLFHKAIMESGAGTVAVAKADANAVGEQFIKVSGLKKDDVKALRALSPEKLLELEMKMRIQSAGVGEAARITMTTPVTDGEVIPELPIALARRGVAKDIPAIIGTNRDEWKLFAMMQPGFDKTDEATMMQRLISLISADSAKAAVDTYRQALAKRGAPVTPADILSAVQTDLMFRVPALDLATAQRDNGAKVYNYLFDWVSPVMGGVLGACHALEIGFVFGTHDDMLCGTGLAADKLSECMQDAWLSFARTGNPACKCIPEWPEYGPKRMTMILGKNIHVEAAPFEAERAVWDKLKRPDALAI
jgi:para-nitrobenzyl esterase